MISKPLKWNWCWPKINFCTKGKIWRDSTYEFIGYVLTTRQSQSTMTATFIDLATATTTHFQPPDHSISSTTYPSTIDNVYLVHRLLFASNSCHRPTRFRTSSKPHHIVGVFVSTIFIAANHPTCHMNRKILKYCNVGPLFVVNGTNCGRISGLHEPKWTNEYTTTQIGDEMKRIGCLKWKNKTTINRIK